MYRCFINDEDCPYLRDSVCNKPSDEKCSHSIWVDEGPEGFIQLPVGAGKTIGEIAIVAGGGKSVILEKQSVGRSKRIKPPILRSLVAQGGIWEVFSEDQHHCGLSLHEMHTANLVYFLKPNEKEPVFILKNRHGPTRYMGMECLKIAISKEIDRLLYSFLGKCWDEFPRFPEVNI